MPAIDLLRRRLADAGVPAPEAPKRRKPYQVAFVDVHACTACGLCAPHCPAGCIAVLEPGLVEGRDPAPVQVRYDECVGCHLCVEICAHVAGPAAIRTYETNLIEQVLGTEIGDEVTTVAPPEPWDESFAEGGGFHHMGEGSRLDGLLSEEDRTVLAEERRLRSEPR